MERLILTSAGFENENIKTRFIRMIDKNVKSLKVLFIPTAAITEEQKKYIPKCKNDLESTGIRNENIRNYDLDSVITYNEIKEYDAIYVCGGDPMYLLGKMIKIGFDKLLIRFFENNGIYIGVSAGSIVMSENLEGNLGYLRCMLKVHQNIGTKNGRFSNDDFEEILLTDNQAIILHDEIKEIVE
jgi:peptidase E